MHCWSEREKPVNMTLHTSRDRQACSCLFPPHFLLLFLAVSVIFCYIKVFSHSCFTLPLHYTLLHPKQTLKQTKMYTHTPTSKFLVLSPIESGPETKKPSTNKFLVLSPTESGPHSNFFDEASSTEDSSPSSSSSDAPTPLTSSTPSTPSGFLFLGHPSSSLRARSDSCSSSSSSVSTEEGSGLDVPQLKETPSPLPSGFLYLGHHAPRCLE